MCTISPDQSDHLFVFLFTLNCLGKEHAKCAHTKYAPATFMLTLPLETLN